MMVHSREPILSEHSKPQPETDRCTFARDGVDDWIRRVFGDDLVKAVRTPVSSSCSSSAGVAIESNQPNQPNQRDIGDEGLEIELVNGVSVTLPPGSIVRWTDTSVAGASASGSPERPLEPPIRPLGEIAVPAWLDGSRGSNRAPASRLIIKGGTDNEALSSFLIEYDRSPATHRTYRRECERLILWCIHVRGRPLSSLDRDDFEKYMGFLSDPQPREHWCGPKADRAGKDWRPFVGPISESAKMTAFAAISSFMAYLVDGGYLSGNPLGLIRQRRLKMSSNAQGELAVARKTEDFDKVERFLDEDMWMATTQAVEDMPRSTPAERGKYERARFILALLYMMGPRAAELESHKMDSFKMVRSKLWWYVVGKGSKAAKVPAPDDMVTALSRYRKHLGLSSMPGRDDQTPLLGSISDPMRPITARRLNQILKEIFHAAADLLPESKSHKAEKLRAASAHWGRHTAITAKFDSGMSHNDVQHAARHGDSRTTDRYIHTEDSRRHEQSQKHRLIWKGERDAIKD